MALRFVAFSLLAMFALTAGHARFENIREKLGQLHKLSGARALSDARVSAHRKSSRMRMMSAPVMLSSPER